MNQKEKAFSKWHELITQYAISGQTVTAFCTINNVSRRRFYIWLKRFSTSQNNKPLELLPIAPATSSKPAVKTDSGVSIEVHGVNIHLQANFDADSLRRVLEVAGGVLC